MAALRHEFRIVQVFYEEGRDAVGCCVDYVPVGSGEVDYRCALCGFEVTLVETSRRLPVDPCPYDPTSHGGVNVWVDDERVAPEGWVWVKTAEQAIAILETDGVDSLSLDHDLGDRSEPELTGYTVCLWLAENGHWPKNKPTVHSSNAVGAANMRSVIDRYGGY